ncbi:MAG: DoxX family protein, partial [Pseudomonadales bacterium]|nr:DoxX family protein [Pseudomonadales bacterium]
DCIYASLRIVTGLAFAFHGMQKVFGVFGAKQFEVGSQFWIGGVIELVGGFLVAFGLLTRWAAFICSGTMAVAYIQFHWKFQFDKNFFPGVNNGELALIYSFLFLYIAARGAGCCSLDRRLS